MNLAAPDSPSAARTAPVLAGDVLGSFVAIRSQLDLPKLFGDSDETGPKEEYDGKQADYG